MTNEQRKSYDAEFKAKAVLESFQRDTTLEAVCKKYSIHASVLNRWRQIFKTKIINVFDDQRNPKAKGNPGGYPPGRSPDDLKKIIGELTIENEILKKVSGLLG